MTYTITVSSAGPSTLSQINLADTLPAALTSPVFTPATGAYDSGTGAWTGITLASGGSVSMTVSGTINAAATGTLVNSVAVAVVAPDTETNTANNTASDTDTLVRRAELTVTKTDGQTNATPGAAVTYTITVSSAGPSTLSQINLVDTLPAALTSPVFTPATGTYTSGTGAWTGITLASGGSVSMTVSGTISAAATGTLVNSVAVAVVAPDTESNTANNTASDTDTLVRRAELTVTKTDGQTNATPGAAVTYTITVSSAGPSTLSQINLVDTLPAALTSPVFTPATGTYTSGTGAWTGITLASGGSVSMTVSGTINPAATGTLVNSVAVAVVAPDTETNTANNTASDTDTLVPSADVAITKTGPAAVAPGQNVTYTITVTNNGPSNAAGVSVADTTPAGLTFVSNSGDCAIPFACNLGAMTVGQVKTITTTFAIGAGYASASLSNTATVAATTADPVSPNNSSTATSTVTTDRQPRHHEDRPRDGVARPEPDLHHHRDQQRTRGRHRGRGRGCDAHRSHLRVEQRRLRECLPVLPDQHGAGVDAHHHRDLLRPCRIRRPRPHPEHGHRLERHHRPGPHGQLGHRLDQLHRACVPHRVAVPGARYSGSCERTGPGPGAVPGPLPSRGAATCR